MGKNAAILIIGNEILSGKVEDENGTFLARELRALGVDVRRIAVIPDEESVIADEISICSRRYDWIFTTGGVGPTHDDVTISGIAQGLGRKVVRHPELETIVRKIYGANANDAALKLAEVPEGTELIWENGLRFPVVMVANIFIFPGIPKTARRKFAAIKSRFQDKPFHLKKIYLKAREEQISGYLHQILKDYPELMLGSYPVLDNEGYTVILTLESKDPKYLNSAFHELSKLLPKDQIVKTE